MSTQGQFVVFALDDQLYALHLSAVEKVVRAVAVTLLPKSPAIILGVINLQGRIIPLVNLRRRFRLPERELELTDQLIVARASKSVPKAADARIVALVTDAVRGVVELSEPRVLAADAILPGLEYLEGVARTEQGIVLIHDLGTFLSLEEERALDELLQGDGG